MYSDVQRLWGCIGVFFFCLFFLLLRFVDLMLLCGGGLVERCFSRQFIRHENVVLDISETVH